MRHFKPGGSGEVGMVAVEIQHLIALTLADRIVAERGHAVASQQDGDTLIAAGRLAIVAVPAGNQHRRKRSRRVGKIQIGGDVMVRPAGKDHLLNTVAFAL